MKQFTLTREISALFNMPTGCIRDENGVCVANFMHMAEAELLCDLLNLVAASDPEALNILLSK